MQDHLALLRARRSVLAKPLPPRTAEAISPWCQDDEFAFESRGFYASVKTDPSRASPSRSNKKKRKGTKSALAANSIGIRKPEKSSTRNRTSLIWTGHMDRSLRKSLRKWGWGSWTRIERSKKLPPEYTAKIIAKRAKELGYTRANFPTAAEKRAIEQSKARMIKSMVPGRGTGLEDPPVYFYHFNPRSGPRPVRLVSIGGIVVQKQDYRKITRFILDDGTGTANCMYWNSSCTEVLGNSLCITLGQFAQVRGKLEWKKGAPCIVASRIQLASKSDAELMWWLDLADVHRNVYSLEYNISVPADTQENLMSSSRNL